MFREKGGKKGAMVTGKKRKENYEKQKRGGERKKEKRRKTMAVKFHSLSPELFLGGLYLVSHLNSKNKHTCIRNFCTMGQGFVFVQ